MRGTRREWLAGCGAALLNAAERYRPVAAAQSYIWLQQFAREGKSPGDGVGEALAATRRAGFRRIELMPGLLASGARERTLEALEREGLEVPILYFGGPVHAPAAAEATSAAALALAEAGKRAGACILNFNPDPKPGGARKSDDELDVQARAVNALAGRLAALRFELTLHHHLPEMAEDAREWRHLLHHTELALCVDADWVRRGGQDPVKLLGEAGRRVRSLHLRNSRHEVWCESLSGGDVDYRAIAAYLSKSAYSGYLVVELAYQRETQLTTGLEENLRRSREYLRETFGVEG
jgi:sugar phosphate isomerase/epimerase